MTLTVLSVLTASILFLLCCHPADTADIPDDLNLHQHRCKNLLRCRLYVDTTRSYACAQLPVLKAYGRIYSKSVHTTGLGTGWKCNDEVVAVHACI